MEKRVSVLAAVITIILTVLVVLQYRTLAKKSGTIVIPGGNTYLGKITPTPQPAGAGSWRDVRGKIYPYTFRVPETITLTSFDNNPFDIYAIVSSGIDPGSNVLIGIDPKANPKEQKLTYVQNWWKQFSGLKSVASIEQFTNANGLKGYKAVYVNSAGQTPNLDVFFEVPGYPQYVIHLASGSLNAATFAEIVNSVGWAK